MLYFGYYFYSLFGFIIFNILVFICLMKVVASNGGNYVAINEIVQLLKGVDVNAAKVPNLRFRASGIPERFIVRGHTIGCTGHQGKAFYLLVDENIAFDVDTFFGPHSWKKILKKIPPQVFVCNLVTSWLPVGYKLVTC